MWVEAVFGELAVELSGTEFTSVNFRILHYRNSKGFRVVQNPENHRNESGGEQINATPLAEAYSSPCEL